MWTLELGIWSPSSLFSFPMFSNPIRRIILLISLKILYGIKYYITQSLAFYRHLFFNLIFLNWSIADLCLLWILDCRYLKVIILHDCPATAGHGISVPRVTEVPRVTRPSPCLLSFPRTPWVPALDFDEVVESKFYQILGSGNIILRGNIFKPKAL